MTCLSFDVGKVALNKCIFSQHWVIKISLNGRDAQDVTSSHCLEMRKVTFQTSKLTEYPTLCLTAFGPIQQSGKVKKDVEGRVCMKTGGYRELGIVHFLIKPDWCGGCVCLHDPSMMAVSPLPITLKINLLNVAGDFSTQTLRMPNKPNCHYERLNRYYIHHWYKSEYRPIPGVDPRCHSPYYYVDGKLLPITYWVRQKLAFHKTEVAKIKIYFENALNRIIETSCFCDGASFLSACAIFERGQYESRSDEVLRVVGELILFRSRFADYNADDTVLSHTNTELYNSICKPYERDAGDCEDFAKQSQLIFLLIKDVYAIGQCENVEMKAVLHILSLYTIAICQGIVKCVGGLTNHMWACLIPRTEISTFTGRAVKRTPNGLLKLIIEGTSANEQSQSEDVLAFYQKTRPCFYKYILDLHIHHSEVDILPICTDRGTCTDFIWVNESTKCYGMKIEQFFELPCKHRSHEKTFRLLPAVYVTTKEEQQAQHDFQFSFLGKLPELLQLKAIRNIEGRCKWIRVYLPGGWKEPTLKKDVIRVSEYWALSIKMAYNTRQENSLPAASAPPHRPSRPHSSTLQLKF
tara:strand:+ start:582 stop:2318 length:1737 start_codon:yes stop_codon:yes gene_type:complete